MHQFELRPCTADDLALTYEITKDAMSTYVQQTWGTWDEDDQVTKHREGYVPESQQLVHVSGKPAGLIAVEVEPAHLWLVKLYLLSSYRSRGLGSVLLTRVLQQAHAQGKRVRLRVLRVNTAARRFYERHGFKVIQEAPERFFMESGA
jgi:ribosomal protein S18 acetylase RimI-like enzyme